MKIDREEKEIMETIEAGKWSPVKDLKAYKKHLQEAARKTILKNQRMNIRISKKDLDELKAKAIAEGMPYQTLVSSVLHKYLTGKLKDTGT